MIGLTPHYNRASIEELVERAAIAAVKNPYRAAQRLAGCARSENEVSTISVLQAVIQRIREDDTVAANRFETVARLALANAGVLVA